MAENIIQHLTIEGQRWDNIAHEYYGSPMLMPKIIRANPLLPVYDVLPGGIYVDVPIIERAEVLTDAEKNPPWK